MGMHRSGTSALGGALEAVGIDFGQHLMSAAFDNPKGFFENQKIVEINESILNQLNSSWDALLPLPEQWWEDVNLEEFKKQIKDTLKTEFGEKNLFAIKDPRLCRLLPLWTKVLEEINTQPYVLIILRNPSQIAASLLSRNHFPKNKSLILWANYILFAELYSRKYKRKFIQFEDLLSNPNKVLTSIKEAFQLDLEIQKKFVDTVIDNGLRHHKTEKSILKNTDFQHLDVLYNIVSNQQKKQLFQVENYYLLDTIRTQHLNHLNFFYKNILNTDFYAHLWIDTGKGFRMNKPLSQKIENSNQVFRFSLNEYQPIIQLRFDPIDTYCVVQLKTIQLIYKDIEKNRCLLISITQK